MRPLSHPSLQDVTVEGILHALSDPVRASIYTGIVDAECSRICSSFTNIADRPIPKSSLSQHFKILREAGLIRAERRGVEMHITSRCEEIEARFPGLIRAIVNARTLQAREKTRTRPKASARAIRGK